jgi:hypothetical protein
MIQKGSLLWQYLSENQRDLYNDGEFLVYDCEEHKDRNPSDYSYLVFPFAKMYEGFLKQLFLDLNIIDSREYNSDHFRIGKALSPNLARILRRSAYGQISKRYGQDLAIRLWQTWKEGRNLVFHYFPHNYRLLTKDEAINLVNLITDTMESAVVITKVRPSEFKRI